MSFDECMQLLAETFPLAEPTESTQGCLDASAPPAADLMMPTDTTAFTQNALLQGSLDQAWMELLSLPELQTRLKCGQVYDITRVPYVEQEDLPELRHLMATNSSFSWKTPSGQCLNMPSQEPVGLETFIKPSEEVKNQNYSQYLSKMDKPAQIEACPPEYVNMYNESFNLMVSPNLSEMSLNVPDAGTEFAPDEFNELFYPEMEVHANLSESRNVLVNQIAEIGNDPPVNTADLQSFSPGNFGSEKQDFTEFPDSDSGLSLDEGSPGKSFQGDESFGFSDSDSDEMEGSPESLESDYNEIFPLVYLNDGFTTPLSENALAEQQEMTPKNPKIEPTEESGHSKPPFTKDKLKKRSEARLSRDEQRAKALQIPFSVDMIINLPVDDFNETMTKHQLNEAQLALIRDIRRRGKNKVAAQNCRKRKLENIVGLEYELDSLREEKERLKKEKSQRSSSLKEMKQQLSSLYQEVFGMLRDEHGKPFSHSEYSLQHTADGTVFLVPRLKKTVVSSA
ncbi:hypothetical protein DNTS_016940 [Danionella cerebrum]|nr:hypothetical protein DNTS_016940 [Danionella translucida]